MWTMSLRQMNHLKMKRGAAVGKLLIHANCRHRQTQKHMKRRISSGTEEMITL